MNQPYTIEWLEQSLRALSVYYENCSIEVNYQREGAAALTRLVSDAELGAWGTSARPVSLRMRDGDDFKVEIGAGATLCDAIAEANARALAELKEKAEGARAERERARVMYEQGCKVFGGGRS